MIYKNFKLNTTNNNLAVNKITIFVGHLLGIYDVDHEQICFYDWENLNLIRKIDCACSTLSCSDNSTLLAIASDDGQLFLLSYDQDAINSGEQDEDGYENAFEIITEINDRFLY